MREREGHIRVLDDLKNCTNREDDCESTGGAFDGMFEISSSY